jgi:hypothetical protein
MYIRDFLCLMSAVHVNSVLLLDARQMLMLLIGTLEPNLFPLIIFYSGTF